MTRINIYIGLKKNGKEEEEDVEENRVENLKEKVQRKREDTVEEKVQRKRDVEEKNN